ncbi:MAG: cell division protein FtsZ [Eubacteriaceae bacterium]|nr:cell division protein FtsZ [Eubacteriaceae bacterium]
MAYEFETEVVMRANIKVFGVGGGGCNAVNRMIESSSLGGVTFYAVNTDSQVLVSSLADNKVQIGEKTTKGLGAGANPEVGERSAEESADEISAALEGADMVFITAGMGGGTGTGASHVIAKVAKEMGILVIGVVTRPFGFEGRVREMNSDLGIQLIKDYVDALVIIPNDRLLQVANQNTSFKEAFKMADDVLLMGVKGITDIISDTGLINLDFADVRTIVKDAGLAHMGIGIGIGENKAEDAARQAISSPLLETTIEGATGVLLNITGGNELTLFDVNKIASIVREEAHPEANVIFGASIDPDLEDTIKVTLIATGFENRPASVRPAKQEEETKEKEAPKPKEPKGGGFIPFMPSFLEDDDDYDRRK